MRSLIASLEGVSILLTSHNLHEIEELCDRVAVISKGEIRAVNTPENLRRENRSVQSVRISLKNLDETVLRGILSNFLDKYSVETRPDHLSVVFERDADDELLGKTIAELTRKGALILDVETEKATLLDVLESYG
jgi:ABC-2 type transport system ATP-binding protein